MTGPVSWEVLIWVVGLMITAGGVVAGFVVWVWRIAAERDTAAQLEKERAKMVEAELRQDLNNYKIDVADKYATKDGVTAAVGRVESSIDKLSVLVHDSVERLTDRLDRVLERRADGRAQSTD